MQDRTLPLLPATPQAALMLFNEYADDLTREWVVRCKRIPKGAGGEARAKRSEGPKLWFKREAYRLISHYLVNDQLDVVRKNFKTDNRAVSLVEASMKNPFKKGLLGMLSDDSILSASERHIFGNQMLYAWSHHVPWDFINGFLALSGGAAAVAARLKKREPQPEFEHRFDRKRLNYLD
jgi:hypothetical protein